MNLDQQIDRIVQPVTEALSSFIFFKVEVLGARLPLVVLWLVAAGIFATFYFRFINVRAFRLAIDLVRGKYDSTEHTGEVSHFQALATALSGTVGIGNIGGVAIAIGLGGPGATFWLIVAGIIGMSTKFMECTLAVRFRRENADGTISGGPMYYLERGIKDLGFPRLGKGIGVFYAAGIVIGCLGIGNMFQSNQAFVQFVAITGGQESWFLDKGLWFGLVLASVVGVVIIGGLRSIVKVTEKVVPFMAALYLVMAIVIIFMNFEAIPWAVMQIIEGAFSPKGVAGGAAGVMIIGFQRAVFSNEAGIGSAAIAHSAVRTEHAASEGIVSLLEPFIDTIIICTATSLVIVTSMFYVPDLAKQGLGGVAMTSAAFGRSIGWFPYLLAVAALLFAFSTAISWAYYGLKGFTYLFGHHQWSDLGFKFIYCVFVALGSTIKVESVLNFADAMVFVICIPNILGLYLMAPVVKEELVIFMKALEEKRG